MGLADLLVSKQPEVTPASVKQLIEKGFTQTREIQPLVPLKQGGRVRSSSFAGLCPREEVLVARHKVVRHDAVDSNSMLTFAHGTAIHHALQDEVLPAIGVLRGEWACLKCGHHMGGGVSFKADHMIPRPNKCAGCGAEPIGHEPLFRYVEQFFVNSEYGISGHPDGYLELPGREGLGVIEAKSISSKGAWEVKKVPKVEHFIQAQIYLWFTGLKWACILYWDKGTYGINALVEHYVNRDEAVITKVLTTLSALWEGIENNTLPERICVNSTCARASECPVVKQCFAEN